MGLSIRDLLIGADPFQIGELWRTCYVGSAMNGRRGMVIHALGAVEMALWDLCGKAVGLPVHALLGGATRDAITPYASLLPGGDTFAAYRDAPARPPNAVSLGFRAVKTEILINGPYAHAGMARATSGTPRCWPLCARRSALTSRSWSTSAIAGTMPIAAWTIQDWAEFDCFFLETLIGPDNLRDRPSRRSAPMPIAYGEWLATRFEFAELMETGVQIVQPDVGRVGGIGEAKIVCDMAHARGMTVVPHCWKTGVSISATAHLAFVAANCAFIEYLPPQLCHERLRRELAHEELELRPDGTIPSRASPDWESNSIGTPSTATGWRDGLFRPARALARVRRGRGRAGARRHRPILAFLVMSLFRVETIRSCARSTWPTTPRSSAIPPTEAPSWGRSGSASRSPPSPCSSATRWPGSSGAGGGARATSCCC